MSVNRIDNRYISRSPSGEPKIEGTRITVRILVQQREFVNAPEQLIDVYPHLTLAQIFDALSYYHDNKEEIEYWLKQNEVTDDLLC